mgnify:FL=1
MKIRIDCLIWHGCEYGKRQLTKLQRRFSDGCKNPYRCAECGSKDILCRAWLDGNTYEADSLPDDSEDLWCEACSEHTWQVRESELMSDTVEPWWNDGTTEEDREIITGLNPENFSPKDDRKAFRDACDMWWNGRTNDEKIRLWRQATAPEEE